MALEIASPAVIRCGEGEVCSLPEEARRLGARPVVVTGRHLRDSDLIHTLVSELDSACIAPPVFPEPSVNDVDSLAEFVKSVSGM